MTDNTFDRLGVSAGLLALGVAAAIGAAIITFSPNHSLVVGAGAIAVTAVLSVIGLVLLARGFRFLRYALLSSIVSIVLNFVVAAVLLGFVVMGPGDNSWLYVLVVGVWAALVTVASVVTGWFLKDRALARDFLVMGALAAILAIVEVVVPLSDVYAVGIVGAYFAVFAVYVIIAGLSLRFATRDATSRRQVEEKK